jgi:hypothetical protein
VADLDHALQTYELSFIHFIAPEQFGVVAEITQEPVELPKRFRAAIEPAGNDVPGKPVGLATNLVPSFSPFYASASDSNSWASLTSVN